MFIDCAAALNTMLPKYWHASNQDDGLQIFKFSTGRGKVIQRSLLLDTKCSMSAFFHGRELPTDHSLLIFIKSITFQSFSAANLAAQICQVVTEFRLYEVCCGAPKQKFKVIWHKQQDCFTDVNPFHEMRYSETCRSKSCSYAIPQLHRQCTNCSKVMKRMSARVVFKTGVSPTSGRVKTPSKFKSTASLISRERERRIRMFQKLVRNLRRQNSALRGKLAKLVEDEGVEVDEELDKDLIESIQNANKDGIVTDFHKLFLQQQLQASKVKGSKKMKWHPLMIR